MNTTENQNDTKPADKWAAEKAAHAHAQGKRIEWRYTQGDKWSAWYATTNPAWSLSDEYRIPPDPTPAGKLSDKELGEIGRKRAYGVQTRIAGNSLTSMCPCNASDELARTAFASAVRDQVEKDHAEEIARLTAELTSLQKAYEVERHCSGERMAQILELKREVERVTAELEQAKEESSARAATWQERWDDFQERWQVERKGLYAVKGDLESQLAAVTAERDIHQTPMNTPVLRCPAAISFLLHCHTSSEPYEPQSMVSSESADMLVTCGAIELDVERSARAGCAGVYRTTSLGCAWVELLCTTPAPQPVFVDAHGNLIKMS